MELYVAVDALICILLSFIPVILVAVPIIVLFFLLWSKQ